MKSILVLILFVFLNITLHAESNYDKDQLLLSIDNGLKTNDTILVSAISRSVDYYQTSKDEKFLLRFLKKFEAILNHKDAFFLVDNLTKIYKKDPIKFEKALREALSKKDYDRFMRHMKNILEEAANGNG